MKFPFYFFIKVAAQRCVSSKSSSRAKEHYNLAVNWFEFFSNKISPRSPFICSSSLLISSYFPFLSIPIRCPVSPRGPRFARYIAAYSIIPQLLHNIKSRRRVQRVSFTSAPAQGLFFSPSRFCSHAYVFSRCIVSLHLSRKCFTGGERRWGRITHRFCFVSWSAAIFAKWARRRNFNRERWPISHRRHYPVYGSLVTAICSRDAIDREPLTFFSFIQRHDARFRL